MKRYLIFLVTVILAFGQFANASENEICNYYQQISKAEEMYMRGAYQETDQVYKIVFNQNPRPYVVDLQNALFNALNLQEKVSAFQYAKMLAMMGVGANYFEKSKLIANKLNKDERWKELLQQANVMQRQLKLKNKNVIDIMQRYSENVDRIMANFNKNPKTAIESQKAITLYADSLNSLLEQNGIPSNYELGVNIINDTIIGEPVYFNIIKASQYDFSDKGNKTNGKKNLLINVFKKALDIGKISPYDYFRIFKGDDLNSNSSVFFEAAFVENDIIKLPILDQGSHQRNMQKRAVYCLPDWKAYEERLIYHFKNKLPSRFDFQLNIDNSNNRKFTDKTEFIKIKM